MTKIDAYSFLQGRVDLLDQLLELKREIYENPKKFIMYLEMSREMSRNVIKKKWLKR